MRDKKKIYRVAKLMYKNSLKNGAVDAKLVGKILKKVTGQKAYGLSKILIVYKNLIAQKIAKEEILVEASTLPQLDKSAFLKKTGAKRIVFKKNSDLVFGAKITHGDWVWEETLDSRLEQIKNRS